MKAKFDKKQTIFQKFGLFFFERGKTTLFIWLVLVVFGMASYLRFMNREGFPNVEVPVSFTSGSYFVNDKSKVDKDILKPLSEKVLKLPSIKKVRTSATDNFFTMIVEYNESFKAADGVAAIDKVIADDAFLPKSSTIESRSINAAKINDQYDVLLSVYSAKTDLTTLATDAESFAKSMEATTGVKSIKVLSPFKSGVDPVSGKLVSLQQTFDRIGMREGSDIVFHESVALGVVASSGTDAIHLENQLQRRIDMLTAGSDTKAVISAGFARNIKDQIGNLQVNLLEGLVVVIIVSFILINWRAGLATALSMASVLLITIAVLYVVRISLNTITLFALVLCLGLIVDDTTIMVEAIDASREPGQSRRKIVGVAIKRVARASTAGTFVTMMAFAPMLFISGILGSFIKVMPITIIISLGVSLLVSLTLIPFFSRWLLLSKKAPSSKSINPVLRLESWISSKIADTIRVGIKSHKKAIAIGAASALISLAFLAGSVPFFKKLKFDIFPSTKDSNTLSMTITFPSATKIDQAQAITDQANAVLASQLGKNLSRVAYVNSGNARSATSQIELISFKKRDTKSPDMVRQLNTAFADFTPAKVKVGQQDAGPPKDDLPFRAQIYSEDAASANRLAGDIKKFLDGRSISRTTNNTSAKIVRVDLAGAQDLVIRINSKEFIEVRAGFDADDTSALVSATQKVVENEFDSTKLATYGLSRDSLKFDFGNESNNQKSFKTMLIAFPILLVVMYIMLAFQFKSLLQPMLIFMAIPFSFLGVAAGLHYTDNPLSFFVMIGFFALIGIAVNNTILLTDYANQARNEGHGHFESMALAVKARFRPLITTSLTSVVALIPLALSDPFWESLAFTLIFGLLSSTLLVIVTFPYYYLAAEYLRVHFRRVHGIAWIAMMGLVGYGVYELDKRYILPALVLWNLALYGRRRSLNHRIGS